jgi:hypothetical protein
MICQSTFYLAFPRFFTGERKCGVGWPVRQSAKVDTMDTEHTGVRTTG